MISVRRENYRRYGECVTIDNGKFMLRVTTQIGPRIIFLGEIGGTNLMYEDDKELITKDGEFFDKNLPGKGIWHIYGGHRLWKSPEYMDTYYPDNQPVQVEEVGGGALFTSPAEITTGLVKSMKITMDDDGVITIRHGFENAAAGTTPPISLWGLSVLDKGAVASIPLSREDRGFLSNRNLVLWSYTDVDDKRLTIANDCVKVTYDDMPPIKIGGLITDKYVKVDSKGLTLTISFDCFEDAAYPDRCCNVECYTNSIMTEIETLSPLYSLKSGECAYHTEVWSLKKA